MKIVFPAQFKTEIIRKIAAPRLVSCDFYHQGVGLFFRQPACIDAAPFRKTTDA